MEGNLTRVLRNADLFLAQSEETTKADRDPVGSGARRVSEISI